MPPKITLPKPPKPTGPPKPKKALTNFAADSSSSDSDTAAPASAFTKPKPASNKPRPASKSSKEKARVNAQLASTSTSAPPPDLDPSVYDYDNAWESMSALSRAAAAESAAESAARQPKYMASLLTSAEVRKRDALRAKERALQKEREAEGDEFAGKEQFVTDAYRRQQAEVAAAEAAEAAREERERAKGRAGMGAFYRGMLERTEERHGAMVDAAAAVVGAQEAVQERKGGEGGEGGEEGDRERELRRARERGAEVNEEGLVVDKTQLLEGGLNVSVKPRAPAAAPARAAGGRGAAYQGVGGKREDARARQSRMVEEQLAAAQKRALEAGEEEKKNLERAAKSRKTESEVVGARERYLQRKREAEEAKKKAQGA